MDTNVRPSSEQVFVREITVQYRGPKFKGEHIGKSLDAKVFMQKVFKDNSREHFIALYLDNAHRVASYSIVSTGTANSCPVAPREVFQPAILAGACAVLVGHNHPSGSCEPSDEDRAVTRRLIECGKLLGIPVLDHLIVSDDEFISFSEQGWMS